MKATILIPKREGFAGYWLLQRFFESGQHELEVTEAQLGEIKADAHVVLVGEKAAEAERLAVEEVRPSRKK